MGIPRTTICPCTDVCHNFFFPPFQTGGWNIIYACARAGVCVCVCVYRYTHGNYFIWQFASLFPQTVLRGGGHRSASHYLNLP